MLEHGSFEFEVVEQTLVVKCFDAWNVETVLRMCSEYKDHVKKINDKPWACLVDLTQWELSTPEMWAHIDELNEWGNLNNQKYEVVVCNSAVQQYLMENSHEVLTNVEAIFCENLAQAYGWLTGLGVYKKE